MTSYLMWTLLSGLSLVRLPWSSRHDRNVRKTLSKLPWLLCWAQGPCVLLRGGICSEDRAAGQGEEGQIFLAPSAVALALPPQRQLSG